MVFGADPGASVPLLPWNHWLNNTGKGVQPKSTFLESNKFYHW
jgi:hypothetical protein